MITSIKISNNKGEQLDYRFSNKSIKPDLNYIMTGDDIYIETNINDELTISGEIFFVVIRHLVFAYGDLIY
jgi:hypothetical protein